MLTYTTKRIAAQKTERIPGGEKYESDKEGLTAPPRPNKNLSKTCGRVSGRGADCALIDRVGVFQDQFDDFEQGVRGKGLLDLGIGAQGARGG